MLWRVPQRIRGAVRQRQGYLVNAQVAPTSYVLQVGDQLTVAFLPTDFKTAVSAYAPNFAQAVTILYEDDDLVVVDKPAGMKMHPHSPTEDDTLLNFIAANFAKRQLLSHGQPARPYMVHRLDRATSGAVLVAKNPVVVPLLVSFLADKTMTRTYYARVSGYLSGSGMVDAPIGVDPTNSYLRQISPAGQQAITHWRAVSQNATTTLVELQLETGRTHQLRVHLAYLGHGIVGDEWYNPQASAPRLLLHAQALTFPKPFAQQLVTVEAPIPVELQ